jgi:competence transcription factor ComK
MGQRGELIALKMKILTRKPSLKTIISNRKTKKVTYSNNLSVRIPKGYECFKNYYKATIIESDNVFGMFNNYLSNQTN